MVVPNSSGRQDEYKIVESEYGKSAVKVLHITRSGPRHIVRELEVSTRLQLSSDKEYKYGDNRDIVSTDSQKNLVYILAKKHGISSPEEFAILFCEFFMEKYPQAIGASVAVVEMPWERMTMNGVQHNHAFYHAPKAVRWAKASVNRKDPPVLMAGLSGLKVLKTTQSSFSKFHKDGYRTLEDTDDRIFSTVVSAEWLYSSHIGVDFDQAWNKVLQCIVDTFAGPPTEGLMSPSVQNTVYLASTAVLESVPQISRIQMEMPNKHYMAVDMSPFPKDMVGHGENNTVFLPFDKPFGFIHAALGRPSTSKL